MKTYTLAFKFTTDLDEIGAEAFAEELRLNVIESGHLTPGESFDVARVEAADPA